jgi:hypothetical protein
MVYKVGSSSTLNRLLKERFGGEGGDHPVKQAALRKLYETRAQEGALQELRESYQKSAEDFLEDFSSEIVKIAEYEEVNPGRLRQGFDKLAEEANLESRIPLLQLIKVAGPFDWLGRSFNLMGDSARFLRGVAPKSGGPLASLGVGRGVKNLGARPAVFNNQAGKSRLTELWGGLPQQQKAQLLTAGGLTGLGGLTAARGILS